MRGWDDRLSNDESGGIVEYSWHDLPVIFCLDLLRYHAAVRQCLFSSLCFVLFVYDRF